MSACAVAPPSTDRDMSAELMAGCACEESAPGGGQRERDVPEFVRAERFRPGAGDDGAAQRDGHPHGAGLCGLAFGENATDARRGDEVGRAGDPQRRGGYEAAMWTASGGSERDQVQACRGPEPGGVARCELNGESVVAGARERSARAAGERRK